MTAAVGVDQVPAIWERAILRYEQTTKGSLLDPTRAKVGTVVDLMSVIEKEQAQFESFRGKRHELFEVLQAALAPVEVVSRVCTGLGGLVMPQVMGLELVFAAVHRLVGAAMGVSDKYDAIVEMMAALKDFTVRLGVYAQQHISAVLAERLTETLVCLLDVLAISRREIRRGRLASFGRNVLLGGDDGKAVLERLRRLTEGEQGLVAAETLSSVRGVSAVVASVDGNVLELRRQLDAMALAQQQQKQAEQDDGRGAATHKADQHKKIKAVLQPSTLAEDKFSAINRSRVPGTCDWIRGEPLFGDWVAPPSSSGAAGASGGGGGGGGVLWVSGTPGAGKSYIASNVITHLGELFPQNVHHPSHASVGYFFFKDDDPKTRSVHQALRDVAYMLCANDPVYAKHVAHALDSPADIASLARAWQVLFADFFAGCPEKTRDDSSTLLSSSSSSSSDGTAYVVLDGLDEADEDERRLLFELVGELVNSPGGSRFRLLMLGRPHVADEIIEGMEIPDVATIHVTGQNNSADIARYIRASIAKSVYLRRVSQKMQLEIISKLSQGAQGMFLWVDLMLRVLLKQRNEAAIRRALNEAPRGIDKMIRHVLEGFSASFEDSPDAAEDLNEMLAFVACAQRPLTLGELDTLLRFRSEDGDGMIWLERTLRMQFASFFTLKREDGLTTADLQRGSAASASSAALALAVGTSTTDADEGGEGGAGGAGGLDGFNDVENAVDFDSDPLTTEVSFCHASIGDFFRNEKEGKARAPKSRHGDGGSDGGSADDCPWIGVDIREAHLLSLRRFLTILGNTPTTADAKSRRVQICAYILNSWTVHLDRIEPGRVPAEERRLLGRSLAQLLLRRGDVVFPAAIFREECVKLLSKFLADDEVKAGMDAADRAVFEAALAGNPADILAPIAERSVTEWLARDLGRGVLSACVTVILFLRLRDGLPPLWTGSTAPPLSGLLTADMISHAAEWLPLDRDALWHRRLGMTLRECGFLDQAIEHFQAAIALRPDVVMVYHGLSKVYEAQKKWDLVIENDTRLLASVEETMKDPAEGNPDKYDLRAAVVYHWHFLDVYVRLARVYEAQGDLENALAMYRKGLAHDGLDRTCFIGTMGLLCWQKRYDEALAVFRELAQPLPKHQLKAKDLEALAQTQAAWGFTGGGSSPARPRMVLTALVGLLVGNPDPNGVHHDWFVAVDRHLPPARDDDDDETRREKEENRRFILDAYAAAIAVARRERKSIVVADLELSYASIARSHGEYETAVRVWEYYATLYKGKLATGNVEYELNNAVVALAEHCLCRCMEEPGLDPASGSPSPEFLRHGRMLEWIAKIPSSSRASSSAPGAGDETERRAGGWQPSMTASAPRININWRVTTLGPAAGDNNNTNNSNSGEQHAHALGDGFQVSADICCMYAHYLRLPGAGRREAEAQELFRQEVRECVRLLSDDDPDNDYEAYLRLTFVLAAVDGFSEDANACLAMACMLIEEGGEEGEEEEEECEEGEGEEKNGVLKQNFRFPWPVCDGCYESVPFKAMWHCRFCNDISLCRSCLDKMRSSTLPVKICSPTHEWLTLKPFPPYPPAREGEENDSARRRDLIHVRGAWMSIAEWKGLLKERFAL